MLIQIGRKMYNQDHIISIVVDDNEEGDATLFVETDCGEDTFVIKHLVDNQKERATGRLSIEKFLGQFFGKVGIKLTLNDPNKIGMDIYD